MLKKLSRVTKAILGKIIIKVLSIPGIKKRLERISQLYELDRLKKELDMLESPRGVRLNFSHYLPDTEQRIDRLRQVIKKRPVAIILLGASLKELEERIAELKDYDMCYFGVNNFRVPEKYILGKINRNFSVVLYSAIRSGADSHMDDAINFLERREDNIFISDRVAFRRLEVNEGFNTDTFIQKYDKKLLFFRGTSISYITVKTGLFLRDPGIEYPLHFIRQSSFSILLSLAIIGESPLVVVFGGDGGRIHEHGLHFRKSSSNVDESDNEKQLMIDTRMFNIMMPLLLEKIYKLYNLKPVDIINCSLRSNYTPLKKLSYDDTFALLKSFKGDRE